MKYIIMDEKNGDLFTEEFESKQDALNKADAEWENLSDQDKKHRTSFYVLESVNPDEDAIDHLDGNIVKAWK